MSTTSQKLKPYLISIIAVLTVSMICYIFKEQIPYKVVALILLLTVSVIGMLFYIIPVLVAVILSVFIWNFFFIPPVLKVGIHDTEDLLLMLAYFFVALLNAVLTHKIKRSEKEARKKEENEKSIKLYNTLFNSLSHELKTPLATIIGSADALKENIDKLTKAQKLDLINEIDIATSRLNRQFSNILNMSRLSSDLLKPQTDWCDINELINNTIEKIHLPYNQSIIYHEQDNLPLFKLDIGFTEIILTNLLINSILYTNDDSKVVIGVDHNDENCILRVSDDGPGITSEEMKLIFNKFYRGVRAKTGGSGLGLSIVKGYTEAQGGTVIVQNNEPSGLVFNINLPCETTYINQLKNE